jgi:hypothetical protein
MAGADEDANTIKNPFENVMDELAKKKKSFSGRNKDDLVGMMAGRPEESPITKRFGTEDFRGPGAFPDARGSVDEAWKKKDFREKKNTPVILLDAAIASSVAPVRPGQLPLSVHAPILMTDYGAAAEGLLAFIQGLQSHSNTAAAEKEAKRLQPYFSALSVYLSRAADKADDLGKGEKEKLKAALTPGKLRETFNGMAAYTRNTLISDVIIAPHTLRSHKLVKGLFTMTLNQGFEYGGRTFNFGFVEAFEGGKRRGVDGSAPQPWVKGSSTTVGIFTLDENLMDDITAHAPEKMLGHMQSMLTQLNHDMLHHFHSTQVNAAIAYKFIHARGFLKEWMENLGGGRFTPFLEEWSQIAHGRVLTSEGGAELRGKIRADIDGFFDELQRIGKAFPQEKGHEVVDYFGTAFVQGLTRAFPLNHPLMAHALERLEQADPLQGKAQLDDAWKKYQGLADFTGEPSFAEVRKKINDPLGPDVVFSEIVRGYRAEGFKILPADDDAVVYRHLKLMQLARISPSDARAHVPKPAADDIRELRENADSHALDLFSQVTAQTTDAAAIYRHKKPPTGEGKAKSFRFKPRAPDRNGLK